MKIAVGKPHARPSRRNVRAAPASRAPDSDLPLLAADEAPMQPLDWEALMHDDVQPALLVGGERRWHGRR